MSVRTRTDPLLERIADVHRDARNGDIIAFGGTGMLSALVKWATRSPVSHVGAVLEIEDYKLLVESTKIGDVLGVQTHPLEERLHEYDGACWWLPLHEAVRERTDLGAWLNFLLNQYGKPYDIPQAVGSDFDIYDFLMENEEDFGRFFCSELVAAALEHAGAVGSRNASEVTPIELCRWPIYSLCYHIKGDPDTIPDVGVREVVVPRERPLLDVAAMEARL